MAYTLILYTIIRDIAVVLIHRDTGQNALYLNFNIISSLTDVSHRLLLLNTKAILISLRQLKCQITPRTLLSLSLENNPPYIYIVLEGIREVCLNINISKVFLNSEQTIACTLSILCASSLPEHTYYLYHFRTIFLKEETYIGIK